MFLVGKIYGLMALHTEKTGINPSKIVLSEVRYKELQISVMNKYNTHEVPELTHYMGMEIIRLNRQDDLVLVG